MTRAEITAMIQDQFAGRTDKDTTLGFAITNALKEIGKRHDFQELKNIETDVDLLSLEVDISDATWDVSELTLTKTAGFADYTYASGDMILITDGTDITTGWVEIASKTNDNTIVLSSSIGVGDETDVDASWIGTPQYVSLPDATHKVMGAVLIDGLSSYNLEIRTKGYVDKVYPAPETCLSTKPELAYRMGSKLRLAPYTDTNYKVRLTSIDYPSLAAGDSAEPTIEGIEDCLIARVLMDLYGGEEFERTARYWENRYERALQILIRDDKRKPSTVHKLDTGGSLGKPNAVSSLSTVRFDPGDVRRF